jgi:hypothetical protein
LSDAGCGYAATAMHLVGTRELASASLEEEERDDADDLYSAMRRRICREALPLPRPPRRLGASPTPASAEGRGELAVPGGVAPLLP